MPGQECANIDASAIAPASHCLCSVSGPTAQINTYDAASDMTANAYVILTVSDRGYLKTVVVGTTDGGYAFADQIDTVRVITPTCDNKMERMAA